MARTSSKTESGDSVLKSLLIAPTDYGVLCLVFLTTQFDELADRLRRRHPGRRRGVPPDRARRLRPGPGRRRHRGDARRGGGGPVASWLRRSLVDVVPPVVAVVVTMQRVQQLCSMHYTCTALYAREILPVMASMYISDWWRQGS